MSRSPAREAYEADITYGTNNEFGFDYLRDNMVRPIEQCVQRELVYAIVDEVDNILIDEARTPLIISGQAEQVDRPLLPVRPDRQAILRKDRDYEVDLKHKTRQSDRRRHRPVEQAARAFRPAKASTTSATSS